MESKQDAQQTRFNNECDAISVVGLEKENVTVSAMGGHIRVPADNNGLISAYIMGDPRKTSSNSENKEEAAGTGVTPDRVPVESGENNIYTHIRNVNTDNPSMESCPYVFEGDHAHSSTLSENVTNIRSKVDAFLQRLNRWSRNDDGFVEHFWAHMKHGRSMSETIWGKMSLGTKIVAQGGVDKMFKLSFSAGPTEKLLEASACYLSTTSGPVAGLLFISTEKLAFCSDRPLSFTFSRGGNASSYFKVAIPLGRVKSVILCENVDKPSEKCIQIQTVDNHDFWFMAFVNYQKAFKHLEQLVKSH